jgi:catechol 2,3-dioxygenase-like lactoylglutathione lyase family enzyme
MRTLTLIAAALLASARIAAADPLVTGVDSVTLTVSDADRAVEFYTGTLGFQKVSDAEVAGDAYEHLEGTFGLRLRVVRLKLGDEALELAEPVTPHGRPIPADSRSDDRWFQHVAIIVSDMDKAYACLRARHVRQVSPEPQALPAWNPNAGGIKAFYFRDPDDHNLEILWFPPDKGAPKWHQPAGDRLFLGIDHTAIAVADTDQSLAFYRDRLGLKVAGESDNYGPEQERLNDVFGAHLRITALRAPSGPGIELLEYLTPRDGRPMPPDTKAGDLWFWHVNLATGSADQAEAALRAGRDALVSPGVVALPEAELGFSRGLTVRDPDGHALMLEQRAVGPGPA